jgi:hypothetical protein
MVPSDCDEQTLRQLAREALRAGVLPDRSPERMWGGSGSGTPCPVCANTVDAEEMELELEFAADSQEGREFHLHLRCFAAWELERKAAAGETG